MKVLQVNCVYDKGSTGKIMGEIHRSLIKNGIESVVCYGRGKRVEEKNVYKLCSDFYAKCNNLRSRITGLMYGGCFLSTNKLIKIIKSEKPDIVHLHCINGYFINIYRIIGWLKKEGIKTVITLHAEFIHTGNCGHAFECDKWLTGCGKCPRLKMETKSWFFDGTHSSWLKMRRAFDGFGDNLVVVSVSDWLSERANRSPILRGKRHEVIYNGVNTEIFHPYDTEKLKNELGVKNEKVIFHATPFFNADPNDIKGGYYILELAKRMKDEAVKFFVAGKYTKNLIVPENVILLGQVSDQKLLAQYYSLADVTVLASKRETFSMVTAESLCCGTPVVGFKAGAPEQIAIPEYSEFVKYGDVDSLKNAVENFVVDKKDSIAENSAKVYSNITMTKNYEELYERFKKESK